MRAVSHCTAVLAMASLVPASPACAQQGPQAGAAPTAEAPSGQAAPENSSDDYAVGPDGQRLFRFDDPPKGASIQFRQIAASVTKVQVVGSDARFELSRLPATFMATIGNEVCTATLIGPKVLLTAGHCVDAKERRDGKWQALVGELFYADGRPGPLIHSCMMAPAYTAVEPRRNTVRNGKDYALCELLLNINITAETIAVETSRTSPGEPILFAGYGCTEKDLIGGAIASNTPTSGTLNVGTNHVSSSTPGGYVRLVGKIGTKNAISCPGDSGGAAFANASIIEKDGDRGRRVVAVISSGGPAGPPNQYVSYLSPLSDPEFIAFVDLWKGKRPADRQICGRSSVDLGVACRP